MNKNIYEQTLIPLRKWLPPHRNSSVSVGIVTSQTFKALFQNYSLLSISSTSRWHVKMKCLNAIKLFYQLVPLTSKSCCWIILASIQSYWWKIWGKLLWTLNLFCCKIRIFLLSNRSVYRYSQKIRYYVITQNSCVLTSVYSLFMS